MSLYPYSIPRSFPIRSRLESQRDFLSNLNTPSLPQNSDTPPHTSSAWKTGQRATTETKARTSYQGARNRPTHTHETKQSDKGIPLTTWRTPPSPPHSNTRDANKEEHTDEEHTSNISSRPFKQLRVPKIPNTPKIPR